MHSRCNNAVAAGTIYLAIKTYWATGKVYHCSGRSAEHLQLIVSSLTALSLMSLVYRRCGWLTFS